MSESDFITSAYGVRMPKIIYGTAWKKEQTAMLVKLALATGFRGIDTACQPKHYFEAGVGDAITGNLSAGIAREAIYLQTKFTPLNGHDPVRIPYDANADSSTQVRQSFEKSLENLKTSYLDGLVLHSPLADKTELLQVWQAMESIFEAGGCRQLGISNCYDLTLFEYLYDKAKIKPAVLQNRFYRTTGYDKALRAYCDRQHVVYQSFWTLSANGDILELPVLTNLGLDYQRSAAQIFFRYLTQQGIIPLTGTTSLMHMRESLAIFEFELTDNECAQITTCLN
ncbi:MAG: aldo/keto reductase [Methylobacter sp.]|nr:MAG: aldo/keto reductase [Methylobacter sp.]PPD20939.1 MAG: aldo/keto reductase [Methylobacter sp.]